MKFFTMNNQRTKQHFIQLVLTLLFLFPYFLQAQQTNYALNVGGTSNEVVYDMAVDDNGNSYVIGVSQSETEAIDFNPLGTAATQTMPSAAVFIAKYNSSGILQWSVVLDNGVLSLPKLQNGSITVDGNGDIYIGMYFSGTNTNFNPLGTANSFTATGHDYVFAKYNSSGINQWVMQIDAGFNSGLQMDMTTDASNNLYVFGIFNGSNIDFNPLGTTTTLTSSNNSYFIAKYNSSGILQLGFAIGSVGGVGLLPSITVDNNNNIYILGTASAIDVNPLGSPVILNNSTQFTPFVAKYNSAGINQWAFNFGGVRLGVNDVESEIVVDNNSDIYIIAAQVQTNDFNPLGTAANFTVGDFTSCIVKYNSSGIFQWRLPLGSDSFTIDDITLDASNDLYVTGALNSTTDLNPLGVANNVNAGKFIAKYNSSGILQNVFSIGSTHRNNNHIGLDNTDNLYYSGYFSDASLDVDPSATTQNLSTNGSNDFLLVSYKNTVLLPVELTDFKGQVTEKGNLLTWQTASEQNNHGFEIERSINPEVSGDWENIGFVNGNGTTTEVSNYEFSDARADVLVKRLYYRLKQIDYDGRFEYSDIISLTREQSNKATINIFPNPVSNQLNIVNAQGQATIHNALGQLVKTFSISTASFTMNTSDFPKGQYTLQIVQDNGGTVTKRFVK